MGHKIKIDAPNRFIHRDLSWLAINERVLEEAADLSNPLLNSIDRMLNLQEHHQ